MSETKVTSHEIMQGWFTKKAGGKALLSKARKRWFVMDDQTISYYEKQSKKKCKGTISVQSIRDVQTNGKELLLITDYRKYQLNAPKVEQTVKWSEAVAKRIKDSQVVETAVRKAGEMIKKSAEIEKHSKELCEYIEILEVENKQLRDEVQRQQKENRIFAETVRGLVKSQEETASQKEEIEKKFEQFKISVGAQSSSSSQPEEEVEGEFVQPQQQQQQQQPVVQQMQQQQPQMQMQQQQQPQDIPLEF